MALNTAAVVDALVSLCQATGLFAQVNGHEPKRAPTGTLTAAVWSQSINPVPEMSGLASSTAVTTFTIRIYTNMLSEPQDAIDPAIVVATDTLMTSIHGDFTLGTDVAAVDLLGQTEQAVAATAGYLDIDGSLYRVMDITVPCIIVDAWSQVA